MTEPQRPEEDKRDSISIIYHQRNDSPKYFEIKRSRVYLFFIGLPSLALLCLIIGAVGLINTSPFHLLESYRQNSLVRSQLAHQADIEERFQEKESENQDLKNQLATLQAQVKAPSSGTAPDTKVPTSVLNTDLKLQANTFPSVPVTGTINSIGLSTLSLFKPIQGQKDLTRPAVLNLSGFKTATNRDTVNLQFNIIPAVTDDSKISGHIVVLMKNELAIQTYPLQALGGHDYQINYSTGEPFATQRFRPVDASFVKPRKSGNYSFSVFIFSRTGDLIHYQSVTLPVNL